MKFRFSAGVVAGLFVMAGLISAPLVSADTPIPLKRKYVDKLRATKMSRAHIAPAQTESAIVETPVLNLANTQNSATPPPEPPKPEPPPGPPYSYALFADIDYVNKLSGGVTGADMDDDPTNDGKAPADTATVGMVHFYGEYDTGAAKMWDNGLFVLHMIYPFGESPMTTVGDLRSVSSVDAAQEDPETGEMLTPGPQLLELWYEHSFPFNHSSVRFGVGYLGSDFYKTRYGGLFVTTGTSSIGTEILWNVMAATPPNSTLGLWYKTRMTEEHYFQAVIFDGFPDHSPDRFFALSLDKDEGAFMAIEGGVNRGKPKKDGYFKLGVGGWYLSQKMETNEMAACDGTLGEGVIGTSGWYVVHEQAISDAMGVFFKGGQARANVNKYRQYYAAGVSYKGILESRPGDTVGAAIVESSLNDRCLQEIGFDEEGNRMMFKNETIFELTYAAPINDWLMLQPDLQWVFRPGMNPAFGDALVAILRAEITFK